MVDALTKKTLASIPLLSVNAGPRDAGWTDRLREELAGLITVCWSRIRCLLQIFPVAFSAK
jgi:hypothetical protein